MKNNSAVGVVGGILIAALAIIAFSVMKNRTLTGYAAIVAATIVLIWFVELIRNDALDFSVRLVLLLVGVALALFSSLGNRLTHYVAAGPAYTVALAT